MSFLCRSLPLLVALGVGLSAIGCSSPPTPHDQDEPTDTSQDELSLQNRTFNVMRSGDGCKIPFHGTLFVKRGGRVTFDNGTWIPSTTEVTSDDNISLLLDWPNALGEDSATSLDITIGEKRSARVPYLDDELFGDSTSLDFALYCVPEGSDWGEPAGKIRIFR